MPDLPGTDLPKMEVWREAGGPVFRRDVSLDRIIAHNSIDEELEALVSCLFTRRPDRAEAGSPVYFREQVKLVDGRVVQP